MTSLLGWSFVQRALLAAVMAAVVCSLLSPFVVMRKMAFMGAGIAHAAFAGVAIGLLAGVDYTATALAFALAVALAVDALSGRGRTSIDVAIGVLFAASMALGVVLISRAPGYYSDLFTYLFGNVLAVTRRDLIILGVTAVAVVAPLLFFLKEMLALCLDEEQALAAGLPVRWLRWGLVSAVAVTVVVSVKVVGIILASALLVIPGAAGASLARNFRSLLLFSLLHGLAASLLGMAMSLRWDLPPGAGIVLVATGLFLGSVALARLRA